MNCKLLFSPLALTFLWAASSELRPAHAADRSQLPSIVLVMADDQGWGDMAYNGHPVLKTPNFDDNNAVRSQFGSTPIWAIGAAIASHGVLGLPQGHGQRAL